jgi:hypothetical protein
MPSARQTANTSGLVLVNPHKHKIVALEGLKVNNQSNNDILLKLVDQFTSDASKTMAADAVQAAEAQGTGHPLSGKVRLEMTVPTGEFQSLGKDDVMGIRFLGGCAVIADAATSDCVVVAQYRLE